MITARRLAKTRCEWASSSPWRFGSLMQGSRFAARSAQGGKDGPKTERRRATRSFVALCLPSRLARRKSLAEMGASFVRAPSPACETR